MYIIILIFQRIKLSIAIELDKFDLVCMPILLQLFLLLRCKQQILQNLFQSHVFPQINTKNEYYIKFAFT